MRPMMLRLTNNGIPPAANRARPPVMEAGWFKRQADQELKKKAKAGEPVGRRADFTVYMKFLDQWFTNDVMPLVQQGNPATAEDVYNAILMAYTDVLEKKHGISQENFNTFKERLDEIRREWDEQPNWVIYVDPKTDSVVKPKELDLYKFIYNKKAPPPPNLERIYPHRIGPHAYPSEKEHLAAQMAYWLTAGRIGSASVGERRPGHDSGIRYINAPDTGGTAKKLDWEKATHQKYADNEKRRQDRLAKGEQSPTPSGPGGHGHVMPDPAGGAMTHPIARRQVNPNRLKKPEQNEDIVRLSQYVTDAPSDAALIDPDVITEAMMSGFGDGGFARDFSDAEMGDYGQCCGCGRPCGPDDRLRDFFVCASCG